MKFNFAPHVVSLSLLGALAVTGCFSLSSYHTARSIEPGTTEIGLAMEVLGVPDEEGAFVTHPMLFARKGISEKMDIGIAAGHFGTNFDLNYMVVETDEFVLSVNPNLTVAMLTFLSVDGLDTAGSILTPGLYVLGDIPVADTFTFTTGVKVARYMSNEEGFTESLLLLGGSLGARIQFSSFHLFPEVNLLTPAEFFGEFVWSLGLGIGL